MKIIDKLISYFEDYVTVISFFMMTIVTLFGVFYRYVLNDPITWSEELARVFMVWGILIGISVVTKKNAQLGIDLFAAYAPEKISKVVSFVSHILLIVIYAVAFILSIMFVQDALKLGSQTPILRIDYFYVYLALPIGFLLSTYRAIQVFWKIFIKKETIDSDGSEVGT